MRKGFATIVVVIVAFVVLAGGGVIVAWRTTYLDSMLPSAVKEFLGRGGAVPSSSGSAGTSLPSSETPSEDSDSTTEDFTKDWKTYTNTNFKFSFKYPADWEISPLSTGEFLIFEDLSGEIVDGQKRPSLSVFPVGGYGSDYGYDAVMGPDSEPQWAISEKAATIGGRSATRSEHTEKSSGVTKLVLIFFGDPASTEMRLAFYPFEGDLGPFDLILETFEFL
jgi:hypothetical protein